MDEPTVVLRGVPRQRAPAGERPDSYRLRVSKQGTDAFGQYLANFLAHSTTYASASEFARDAGVSPSAVSRWINRKERPTPRLLERIAPKMGTSPADLIRLAYPESAAEALAELGAAVTEVHPLAAEVARMLAPDSPVPAEDRQLLEALLERVVEPLRQYMRPQRGGRRSA
jgi:transcriptional regulator with XRE-family HTH domain